MPLNVRLTPTSDPAALPAGPADTFRWATVVNESPLSVRLDGESSPLTVRPSSLAAGLTVGDRVWTQLHGRAVVVLGRGSGRAAAQTGPGLTFPLHIAHRGARSVFPELSMEGQREMAARGYPVEVDVRALTDGTLVACHDSTVDRTMLGVTGAVSSLTPQQWRAARIKPVVAGGASGQPVFFVDWLREMATTGATPVFEVKDGDAAGGVIEAVTRAGLQRVCIAQSFSSDVAAQMADAGLRTIVLFGGSQPSRTVDDIVDSGVWGVGCSTSADVATLQSLHDRGMAVIVYTINTPAGADDWLGRSYVDGVFSDDPEFVARRVVARPSDTFGSGFLSPGCRQHVYKKAGSTTPFHLEGAALTIPAQPSLTDGRPIVVVPELSPRTNNYRVTVDIQCDAGLVGVSQSVSPGIVLWRNTINPDEPFSDEAVPGQEGFTAVGRRNGQLQAWKYVSGAAASSIGSSLAHSGADQFAEDGRPGQYRLVFEVLNGRVRMDAPDFGWHFEASDSFAPGGLTLALRGSRHMNVTFSNVRVVDL